MYYNFRQNNSGGDFIIDLESGVTINVIVEAANAEHANELAEKIGLYFDGEGDCPCCGSRWHEQWNDSNGSAAPEIYGQSIEAFLGSSSIKWAGEKNNVAIHHLNGQIEWH